MEDEARRESAATNAAARAWRTACPTQRFVAIIGSGSSLRQRAPRSTMRGAFVGCSRFTFGDSVARSLT